MRWLFRTVTAQNIIVEFSFNLFPVFLHSAQLQIAVKQFWNLEVTIVIAQMHIILMIRYIVNYSNSILLEIFKANWINETG